MIFEKIIEFQIEKHRTGNFQNLPNFTALANAQGTQRSYIAIEYENITIVLFSLVKESSGILLRLLMAVIRLDTKTFTAAAQLETKSLAHGLHLNFK